MNRTDILAPALLCALACACAGPGQRDEGPHGAANLWLARAMRQRPIDQAVLEGRTLWPHHFETASAELSSLGRRDLGILAERWGEVGELSVRRGDAPAELHQARVDSVLAALEEAGIPPGSVEVVDRPSLGEGMSAERVRILLAKPPPSSGFERSAGRGGAAGAAGSGGAASILGGGR